MNVRPSRWQSNDRRKIVYAESEEHWNWCFAWKDFWFHYKICNGNSQLHSTDYKEWGGFYWIPKSCCTPKQEIYRGELCAESIFVIKVHYFVVAKWAHTKHVSISQLTTSTWHFFCPILVVRWTKWCAWFVAHKQHFWRQRKLLHCHYQNELFSLFTDSIPILYSFWIRSRESSKYYFHSIHVYITNLKSDVLYSPVNNRYNDF